MFQVLQNVTEMQDRHQHRDHFSGHHFPLREKRIHYIDKGVHHFVKPPQHYRFHYDNEVHGWRESVKPNATTRWNKARGAVRVGNYFIGIKKKPNTYLNIDVKKLVQATNHTRQIQTARKMAQEKDESETGTLERALTEPTLLTQPFMQGNKSLDGVWTCPVTSVRTEDRAKHFDWDKPKTERKTLVESASKYQAIYLQKQLKEKDKEMKLIINQLLKSNKENVALLKELEGYRGKNYDELYQENLTLKEQVGRACRENVMLAGRLQQGHNRSLQRLNSGRTSA
ncbi:hypothetical protein ACF0H5_018851 [Mactra antiquata]